MMRLVRIPITVARNAMNTLMSYLNKPKTKPARTYVGARSTRKDRSTSLPANMLGEYRSFMKEKRELEQARERAAAGLRRA